MTGFLHEKDFSRQSFVKGGGAMIVGFSLLGAATAGKSEAATAALSAGPPDQSQIDSWIVIGADNTAAVKLGKVELGQGSMTGLLMVAAEELSLDMSQIRAITNDTNVTPNQGTTAGSSAISSGGKQTRAAAAAAYQALLGLASKQLGVATSSLTVDKGVVSGGGKTVTYGQLLGGKTFNVQIPDSYNMTPTKPPNQSQAQTVASPGSGSSQGLAAAEVLPTPAFVPSPGPGLPPGAPGTKAVSQYKIVGVTSPGRVDIPAKITGKYTYVQNVRVPGMLHGRVVRPRGQGAYGDGTAPQLVSVDESSVAHIPNVKVLRKGNFLAVVAPKEYDAIQAQAVLKVKWGGLPTLPTSGNLFKQMRELADSGQAVSSANVNMGNVDAAFQGAAHVVSQTYEYPYNGHMPIGPTCCVADVQTSGQTTVFSNTQNAYSTRASVAAVLGVDISKVRVIYYEGSSVYGNAPYDDAAEAAAIMSSMVGKPVRLQFMRWDEHGWDNYGPPQLMDVRGAVDGAGNLLGTDMTIITVPWYSTKATEAMLGYQQTFSKTAQIDTSNNGTAYNLRNRRVSGKSLPVQNNFFKTIWLRAPAAPQTTFAYEQMIDELAYAAKMDPYQFRLKNIATQATDMANGITALTWDRWKNVITKAAEISNWQPKVAASNVGTGNVVTGRGMALGTFAGTPVAIVADITVNKKTGKITPTHFYCAQDTGLTVYPDGIANQAEGGLIQGASRALTETVSFDKHQVTSLDWVSYPIMRFKDAPLTTFAYIQRTDIPATQTGTLQPNGTTAPTGSTSDGIYVSGSGELGSTSISAALANAFFDATGVRMRSAPMTPARVRATLKAAGVA